MRDPQQLVFVRATTPTGRITDSFLYPIFEEFRERNRSFSGAFAVDSTRVSVTVEGRPEMVRGDFVSGTYFNVLGVSASGRTLPLMTIRPGRRLWP